MLVILPKRIICDSECQYGSAVTDSHTHTLLKHCVHPHYVVVLNYDTRNNSENAIADFEQTLATKRKNCGLQL